MATPPTTSTGDPIRVREQRYEIEPSYEPGTWMRIKFRIDKGIERKNIGHRENREGPIRMLPKKHPPHSKERKRKQSRAEKSIAPRPQGLTRSRDGPEDGIEETPQVAYHQINVRIFWIFSSSLFGESTRTTEAHHLRRGKLELCEPVRQASDSIKPPIFSLGPDGSCRVIIAAVSNICVDFTFFRVMTAKRSIRAVNFV